MNMNKAYWIVRYLVLGPLLRIVFRIKVVGLHNIPREGGVILASNHQSVIDSFVIMGLIHRPVTFLAKSEYFTEGWIKKKFFSIGAVPVYRGDKSTIDELIKTSVAVLEDGGVIAVHPEGTRAPTPDVYQGKTTVIAIAWRSGAPVVPIALLGTRYALPPGRRLPHFGAKITVIVGEPIDFEQPNVPRAVEHAATSVARRVQAQKLMKRIANLGKLKYLHVDAQQAKRAASS